MGLGSGRCSRSGAAAGDGSRDGDREPLVGGLVYQNDPLAHASIVDGSVASITEFPFQVALYDPRAGSPAKGFFCGGVILDATRVATAAHCLFGERGQHSPPAEIEVLAGSTYLEPTDPGSVRDPVVAATVDPAYNPAASDYDVGVLRLERPLWSGATPPLDGHSAIAPLALDTALAAAHTAGAQTAASPPGGAGAGAGDRQRLGRSRCPSREARRATRCACARRACRSSPPRSAKKRTPRSNSRSRRG